MRWTYQRTGLDFLAQRCATNLDPTCPGWGIHRAFSEMQRIHQGMTPEACGMVECWLASKKRDG